MASPNASAESFSFIASSIACLAFTFVFDFFFFFLVFLLLSELAPPRSFSHKYGRDDCPFVNVLGGDINVFLVVVIPATNFENDKQTTARDKRVLIVQDNLDIVRGSDKYCHNKAFERIW